MCHHEQRYVGAQLTFHYDRKQIILEQTEVAKGLAGRYVEIYDYFDKPYEVRWQGHVLPYRVFNKDQTVRPAAIVENKRLRHALAVVKAKQEHRLDVKIMTNSEKVAYKKRPRPIYGPDFEMTIDSLAKRTKFSLNIVTTEEALITQNRSCITFGKQE